MLNLKSTVGKSIFRTYIYQVHKDIPELNVANKMPLTTSSLLLEAVVQWHHQNL